MTPRPTGYQLPVPSTALNGEVELRDPGGTVTLSFRYHLNGRAREGQLEFVKSRAYCHRAEIHCTATQIQHAYDTLVEIDDSPWATQVRAETTEYWRDRWVLRHFRIFFDSAGCWEFLAESWRASDTEVGGTG